LHLGIGNAGCSEDGWGEDSHTSNTDPLLHDLEPDNELYTTTSVELARADTEKHGNVRLALGGLKFEFSDVTDVLELSFGLANIFTSFTTETSKNVASLFFAANLNEPTGGLGKEPTDCEQEE